MVKNCLVSETQKFAKTFGLDIPSDQARMLDEFIKGTTPLLAYTNIRQSGKTTLGKMAALYHAMKVPGTIVGVKGFKMMHTHNILRFIREGIPDEFVDFADRDRIILINESIIMAANENSVQDIAINDEAPMYGDSMIFGRKKTFAYGSWGIRYSARDDFRRFTLRMDVEFVAMDDPHTVIIPENDLVLRTNGNYDIEWAEYDNYIVDRSILNVPNTNGIEYVTGIDYALPDSYTNDMIITEGTVTHGNTGTTNHWIDQA